MRSARIGLKAYSSLEDFKIFKWLAGGPAGWLANGTDTRISRKMPVGLRQDLVLRYKAYIFSRVHLNS